MEDKPCILLVEDNENDVILMQHACKSAGIKSHFKIVGDGQQAIDYLNGENKFKDRALYPFPDLMLLDLEMPKKDGMDVLKWIHKKYDGNFFPVAVLTSSDRESDVSEAFKHGATSYFIKPETLSQRLNLVKTLHEYWFTLNQFPDDEDEQRKDSK